MSYQIDIKRLFAQIPTAGCTEAVVVILNDDDTVSVYSTADDDDSTDMLLDGLAQYGLVDIELEPDDELMDGAND